jgi:hypothetical protein
LSVMFSLDLVWIDSTTLHPGDIDGDIFLTFDDAIDQTICLSLLR